MLVLFYIVYITVLIFNKQLLEVATACNNGCKRNVCPESSCTRCQSDDVITEKSALVEMTDFHEEENNGTINRK